MEGFFRVMDLPGKKDDEGEDGLAEVTCGVILVQRIFLLFLLGNGGL